MVLRVRASETSAVEIAVIIMIIYVLFRVLWQCLTAYMGKCVCVGGGGGGS